ncbi:USP31 [Acanthosepion pharaonis]|uniref:USP31 n=1 Tax=Acanthosepion pharaonis TaxID=158019 RepID=A0A812D390_ACAPH|nr:USP31 [Sepia pharaonis]
MLLQRDRRTARRARARDRRSTCRRTCANARLLASGARLEQRRIGRRLGERQGRPVAIEGEAAQVLPTMSSRPGDQRVGCCEHRYSASTVCNIRPCERRKLPAAGDARRTGGDARQSRDRGRGRVVSIALVRGTLSRPRCEAPCPVPQIVDRLTDRDIASGADAVRLGRRHPPGIAAPASSWSVPGRWSPWGAAPGLTNDPLAPLLQITPTIAVADRAIARREGPGAQHRLVIGQARQDAEGLVFVIPAIQDRRARRAFPYCAGSHCQLAATDSVLRGSSNGRRELTMIEPPTPPSSSRASDVFFGGRDRLAVELGEDQPRSMPLIDTFAPSPPAVWSMVTPGRRDSDSATFTSG